MAETILDRIVRSVWARLDAAPANPDLPLRAADTVARRRAHGTTRSLEAALAAPGPSVIAEVKHASPSAGLLREPFDPVALARAYEAAGASAISVVVEQDHFLGDPRWLDAIHAAVRVPVLRKDFIVDRRQLEDAALRRADAVLLIQRLLSPDHLADLIGRAAELDLDVLLELFADEDPAQAVASGIRILGVNARDLATFEMRLDRVEALARELPADRLRVAESGIHDRETVARLHAAGYDAFLIGEHLVRAGDPGRALRALL